MAKDYKSKQPTMNDVAKHAGVSAMTVSRALKTDAYVSDKTRKIILKAVEDLGYVLDTTAAGLSSRKTGFVAVVIPSINNANFAQTVRGISQTLTNHGLQILLAYTDYSFETEEKLISQLLSRRPEAIILTGSKHTKKCIDKLKKANIPVIETWELPDKPIGHCVGFSNQNASKLVVEHFHQKGCRKLAFLGTQSESDMRGFQRRKGFVTATKSLGLPDPMLIELGGAPLSMEHGTQAAKLIYNNKERPDAVMAVSDLVAFGFIAESQRLGIDIPKDMLVSGFGAYDISAVANPTITTVNVGARLIGEEAAHLVLQLLQEDAITHIDTKVEVAMTLIERQTTNKAI